MTKAIFFDLFFTLIYPKYLDENENDVIGITISEWEEYAENNELYNERARGKIKNEREIIDKIVNRIPYQITEIQKQKILEKREERIKKALLIVDKKILETLRKIRMRGLKLGIISNADVIDIKYWDDSPLSELFDLALFSCDAGMIKPEAQIYQLAMKKLEVKPEESIFIGDGGSNELYGAQSIGMKTIFTEYLDCNSMNQREFLKKYADFHINNFDELLNCID